MTRPFVAVLASAALVAVLEGCGFPVRYQVSMPAAIPEGYSGSISGDILTLDLPGAAVLAQVQNHVFADQIQPPERLVIFVEFQPENKDELFSFDPTNAVVKFDQGEQMGPVKFIGPDRPWLNPRGAGRGCGGVRGGRISSAAKSPTGPVTFTGRKCFILWYDTSPVPDRGFLFLLGGLKRDQKALPAPSIIYRQGTLRKWHPVP